MKAVICKYKSNAVEYMRDHNLSKEGCIIICREEDIGGLRVDDLIVLEPKPPWYGFDEKQVRKQMIKPAPKKPAPKKKVPAKKKAIPKAKK